jgi:TPR repeat protein
MNTLGFLYQNGLGVEQDWSEAVKWYRRAAEKGDAMAQANLGLMYEDGHGGLPHDNVQAYKWFLLSAEQGNAEGRHDAMEFQLYHVLTPEQIAEAERMVAGFHAQMRTNQPAPAKTESVSVP